MESKVFGVTLTDKDRVTYFIRVLQQFQTSTDRNRGSNWTAMLIERLKAPNEILYFLWSPFYTALLSFRTLLDNKAGKIIFLKFISGRDALITCLINYVFMN